jgi:hypothetical protein
MRLSAKLTAPRQISLLVFTLIFQCPHVHSVCYYPSGDQTPGDIACEDSSQDSACCPLGYACLNMGMCATTNVTPTAAPGSTNFEWMRGSCTDPAWRAFECPSFCLREDPPYNDILDGPQQMGSCDGDFLGLNGYFCVDSVVANCTTKSNVTIPDRKCN